MSTISRITQLAEKEKITITQLERVIGASKGVLSRASKNDTDIQSKWVTKIVENYPLYDACWLLTGKGDMLTNNTLTISTDNQEGVPYYDVDFSGGFNAIFNNQTLLPDHNIVFAPFKDAQLWCNVTGNSMAEKINHGDIIALKELQNWEENILYGEIYAVVTEQLRTIKIIRKSEDLNALRLVPINTQDFDENEVKKSSIIKVYSVLGAIKKFF
nr:S24 family peptidase [uncultured Marinifilum sp.]